MKIKTSGVYCTVYSLNAVHPIDKKTFAAQGNFVTSKSIKHTLTRVRHMRVPHSIFFVPIASLVPRKIKTPKMFLL